MTAGSGGHSSCCTCYAAVADASCTEGAEHHLGNTQLLQAEKPCHALLAGWVPQSVVPIFRSPKRFAFAEAAAGEERFAYRFG